MDFEPSTFFSEMQRSNDYKLRNYEERTENNDLICNQASHSETSMCPKMRFEPRTLRFAFSSWSGCWRHSAGSGSRGCLKVTQVFLKLEMTMKSVKLLMARSLLISYLLLLFLFLCFVLELRPSVGQSACADVCLRIFRRDIWDVRGVCVSVLLIGWGLLTP